ncbi:Secretory carrier-associated membrane protein 2 [Phlyctochytrium bullatum]|nr:Secretory carrier-associated membrane protein 2 [Phlyctochytrium bullatum]
MSGNGYYDYGAYPNGSYDPNAQRPPLTHQHSGQYYDPNAQQPQSNTAPGWTAPGPAYDQASQSAWASQQPQQQPQQPQQPATGYYQPPPAQQALQAPPQPLAYSTGAGSFSQSQAFESPMMSRDASSQSLQRAPTGASPALRNNTIVSSQMATAFSAGPRRVDDDAASVVSTTSAGGATVTTGNGGAATPGKDRQLALMQKQQIQILEQQERIEEMEKKLQQREAELQTMRRRLEERDAELGLVEARLKYREARVTEREQKLGGERKPNWPRCRPIIYHDISKDIPDDGQKLVKRIYIGWFVSMAAAFFNFIGAFALATQKADLAGTTFALSIVILGAGVPVSFVFWYRPLYKAVKNNHQTEYMFFYLNFSAHLLICLILSLGIPGFGGAGIIYGLTIIGSNFGTGVLCAISATLMLIQVIYGAWHVKSVYFYQRAHYKLNPPTVVSSVGAAPGDSPSSPSPFMESKHNDPSWANPSREDTFSTTVTVRDTVSTLNRH